MRQGDMSYKDFCQILDNHIEQYGVPEVVSLQGEGEPTLNHDFFRMARFVRSAGSHVYAITNGTDKHPEHFAESFDVVGISVDSLNPETAAAIGRVNLPGTLHFIEEIAKYVKQIIIHSIYLNGETQRIADWCKQHRYIHVVQPLQSKDDYSKKYKTITLPRLQGPFACPMLIKLDQRYYNLDKLEMPCCFIKDTSKFRGIQGMIDDSKDGRWPMVCSGCSMGTGRQFRRFGR